MIHAAVLALLVACFAVCERIGVNMLTRSERGRTWVREHRIVHPNMISIMRLPMGIVTVLMWMVGFETLAILWFAFWMISDLTDGTLARTCDLVTESGKWLDPLSDKALYFPPLILLGYLDQLPMPWVTAFILIDTFGQLSRLLTKKKAANSFGKAKTALVTVLLSLTALDAIGGTQFFSSQFLFFLMISCTILAFFSVYCKMIPDMWYANSLTLANFLCGLAAIYHVFQGRFIIAFLMVFLGQFFDLFDGRMARLFGSTRHGAIFDDIADGTSFGFAIAVLIAAVPGNRFVSCPIAVLYFVSVVYRLVRFLDNQGRMPDGIFEGLPSPAGAMLAGSSVLVFRDTPTISYGLVLFAAALMVSKFRYRHFARKIWPELPNILKIVMFVLMLVFVNNRLATRNYAGALELVGLALAGSYVVLGTDRFMARLFRK